MKYDNYILRVLNFLNDKGIDIQKDITFFEWSRNIVFQIDKYIIKTSSHKEALKNEYDTLKYFDKSNKFAPETYWYYEFELQGILILEFIEWESLDKVRHKTPQEEKQLIIKQLIKIIDNIKNIDIDKKNIDFKKIYSWTINKVLENPNLNSSELNNIKEKYDLISKQNLWKIWLIHNDIWWKNIIIDLEKNIKIIDRELADTNFVWYEEANFITSSRYSKIEEDIWEQKFWDIFFMSYNNSVLPSLCKKDFLFLRRLKMLKSHSSQNYDHNEVMNFAKTFDLL